MSVYICIYFYYSYILCSLLKLLLAISKHLIVPEKWTSLALRNKASDIQTEGLVTAKYWISVATTVHKCIDALLTIKHSSYAHFPVYLLFCHVSAFGVLKHSTYLFIFLLSNEQALWFAFILNWSLTESIDLVFKTESLY